MGGRTWKYWPASGPVFWMNPQSCWNSKDLWADCSIPLFHRDAGRSTCNLPRSGTKMHAEGSIALYWVSSPLMTRHGGCVVSIWRLALLRKSFKPIKIRQFFRISPSNKHQSIQLRYIPSLDLSSLSGKTFWDFSVYIGSSSPSYSDYFGLLSCLSVVIIFNWAEVCRAASFCGYLNWSRRLTLNKSRCLTLMRLLPRP